MIWLAILLAGTTSFFLAAFISETRYSKRLEEINRSSIVLAQKSSDLAKEFKGYYNEASAALKSSFEREEAVIKAYLEMKELYDESEEDCEELARTIKGLLDQKV